MVKVPAVGLGIDPTVGDEAVDELAGVITLNAEPVKEINLATFWKRLAPVVFEPFLQLRPRVAP